LASRINQRAVVLIEIVDRLYAVVGAMRETGEPQLPGSRAALLAIARVLDGSGDLRELQRLRFGLNNQAASGTGKLRQHMIRELIHALDVAADDELPVLPNAPTATRGHLSALLSPLRANLNRSSAMARHALRFAVVTAVAVIVYWIFPKPFGYWIPLTATVVLKPYAGMTMTRAIQRAVGTGIGVLAGLALMPFLSTIPVQFAAAILLFFAMMLVLPFNYSLAIIFVSAGLIPFEHMLNPSIHAAVGLDRLVATGIGSALALVGGFVLWPTFQRRALPDLLQASAEAMATYADAVIGATQGSAEGMDAESGDVGTARLRAERRRAGLVLSNLQAGLQRSLTEIGGDADAMAGILRAATALQRLSLTLNALLYAAPVLARSHPPLAAFRATLVSTLADPGRCDSPIARLRTSVPVVDHSQEAALLSRALERLISSLEMLCVASTSTLRSRRQSKCSRINQA
jgi:uncharacterized membrane protein YccC